MMNVVNNTVKASNRAFKRTKKVPLVIKHTEKIVQKYFVSGKNIETDISTVG
jgi:hypothetical protein